MEELKKIETGSPGNGTTSAEAEAFLAWVSLFNDNFKKISSSVATILNAIQKSPLIAPNISENEFDMLDLGSEFLAIPSTYFSDKLGGSPGAPINARLKGLLDLESICEMARPPIGRTVLVKPDLSVEHYINSKKTLDDATILNKNPVFRGCFKPSKQPGVVTIKGDSSGLPVRDVLAMRRDQLWFMLDNASTVVAREQSADYDLINEHCRKPYEGVFADLTKGVLSLCPDGQQYKTKLVEMHKFIEKQNKFIEKQKKAESASAQPKTDAKTDDSLETDDRPVLPPSYHYCCTELSVFTILTINKLICEFSLFQKEYLSTLAYICKSLQVLDETILPKLGSMRGVRSKSTFPELGEFLEQVKKWSESSKFDSVRLLLKDQDEREYGVFLNEITPSVLMNQANLPLIKSEEILRTISIILSMYPPDPSPEVSKILSFLLNLKTHIGLMLPHMKSIRQCLGDVEGHEVCSDKKSYLAVYAELRGQYLLHFKRAKPTDSKLNSREHSPRVDDVPSAPTTPKVSRHQNSSTLIVDVLVSAPISVNSPRRSQSSVAGSPREVLLVSGGSPSAVPRSPNNSRSRSTSGVASTLAVPLKPRSPRQSPRGSPRTEEGGAVDFTALAMAGVGARPLEPLVRGKVIKNGERKSLVKSGSRHPHHNFFQGATTDSPPPDGASFDPPSSTAMSRTNSPAQIVDE